MQSITLTLNKCKVSFLVSYTYFYEPESSVPESEVIEIHDMTYIEGDIQEMLLDYRKCQDIIDELEEQIANYEQNDK